MDAMTGPRALAVELWLAGKTDAEVAAIVSVDAATAWRWRKHDPQVVAALEEGRKHRRDAARVTLDLATLDAMELLAATVRDSGAKLETRVRCAEQILDRGGIVAPKGPAAEGDGDRPCTEVELAEARVLARRIDAAESAKTPAAPLSSAFDGTGER